MYEWGGLLFDWDQDKARINLAKWGVSFEEAVTVFGDSQSLDDEDREHSSPDEQRRVTTGRSDRQRVLTVVYAERTIAIRTNGRAATTIIRIIHAARATRRERRDYEEK